MRPASMDRSTSGGWSKGPASSPFHAVRHGFGHFLRHEEGDRSNFLHESLRRFLLMRTAET